MEPPAILANLPDGVLLIDSDARLLWANATAEATFGWTLTELAGEPVSWMVHPDDLVTAVSSLASVQQKELGSSIVIRLRDRRGTYHSMEVRGRAVDEGVLLVLRDVADRGRWEVTGGDDEVFRSILEHAPGITMVVDADLRLRGASRALSALTGRDLESSLGKQVRDLVAPEDAATVEAELTLAMSEPGQRSFEVAFTSKDGTRTVPAGITVVNLLDDQAVRGLVVSAVDITQLTETRERLAHLATHDPLTDLPNRAALTERVRDALAVARLRETTVSLIYCDLDAFKSVNDRYGHVTGDHVLVEVARRLLSATRAGDAVARMGGDEFVILVEDGEERAVQALLTRLRAEMAAPITVDAGEITLTMTAGAASADGTDDVDDLLGRADAAMYSAKARTR